ncbi:MAG: ribonuclease HII, partial [bacterium]|nr:ribonuclease HII [bacterium]
MTKAINFAIRKAITKLAGYKVSHCSKRTKLALKKLKVDRLVIDGKHDFNLSKDLSVETETIVHGDAKNHYISMASIVAKVERDRVMLNFAKKYPLYAFEQNKGYGTEFHRAILQKYGPCKIH